MSFSAVEHAADRGRIAAAAGRVVTMLPSTPQVEAVYLDPAKGILAGLEGLPADTQALSMPSDSSTGGSQAGIHTLLIDQTTLDPTVAMSVAKTVAERTKGKTAMVDAPVSGGGQLRSIDVTGLITQASLRQRLVRSRSCLDRHQRRRPQSPRRCCSEWPGTAGLCRAEPTAPVLAPRSATSEQTNT